MPAQLFGLPTNGKNLPQPIQDAITGAITDWATTHDSLISAAWKKGDADTLTAAKAFANTLAYGTALDATDASISAMVADTTKATGAELAKRFPRTDTVDNVRVVDAKADGSNESAAWTAAINAVGDAGGGVVTAKRNRTYIVENLPLRENVWLDLRGIVLKVPVNGTLPMFVAPTMPLFINGGISGGELIGYNKRQNGIDFSGVTTLEHFILENSYLHDFNVGYQSSGNDRFPVLRDTRFWFNKVGMYVTMNHPIVHFCDFRNNDVGLTGDPNDMFAIGCKFNFNRVGVQPDRTKANYGVRNTRFVGCAFARNTELGLDIDHGCIVVGNQFYGNNSGDDGLRINQSNNTVGHNVFGYMTTQGGNGGASIRFTGTVSLALNTISDNTFQLSSPTGVGVTANSGTTVIKGLTFTGNTCQVSTDRKWIDFNSALLQNSIFANNTALILSTTTHVTGTGIWEFNNLGAGGCDFTGNAFTSERSSTPVHAIKFNSVAGCAVVGNRMRGFATPITATTWAGASWFGNNGFKTQADGTAVIAVGATTTTVTHGLTHPQANNARYIKVTPNNNLGNATKFWVTNVTATTFDIAVDKDPTVYQANFTWSINVSG